MHSPHEYFMRRCLDLAALGLGSVSPNPMVGCVIVNDDRIIGEGYHSINGGNHAEVVAINAIGNNKINKKTILYVSLEPCAHFGKTPPCTEKIIASGIKNVIIGCKDINPVVSGKGINALKKKNINVSYGILEKECVDLNKRFFTYYKKRRPYVILKWAQTKDGFLDRTRSSKKEVGINWISAPETKSLVHKWRSEEQAILVGRNTVLYDNPSLTVREWEGDNPIRIIIDSQLQTNIKGNTFSDGAKTLILNRVKSEVVKNIEYIKIQETSTKCILEELHKRGIQSVLIEGGSRTLQYFIIDRAWDEARVIVGNQYFDEGVTAPVISKIPHDSIDFGEDKIYFYYRK